MNRHSFGSPFLDLSQTSGWAVLPKDWSVADAHCCLVNNAAVLDGPRAVPRVDSWLYASILSSLHMSSFLQHRGTCKNICTFKRPCCTIVWHIHYALLPQSLVSVTSQGKMTERLWRTKGLLQSGLLLDGWSNKIYRSIMPSIIYAREKFRWTCYVLG